MNHRRRAAMVGLATALAAGPALGREWTRFRGPNGTGSSDATTVPVRWKEGDFNWKIELPGTGHSSPVAWGDKIFVTCADPKSSRRSVLCIRPRDGKTHWQRDREGVVYKPTRNNSLASSTPAVDAQHVYVSEPTPEQFTVFALTHKGKPAWSRDLGPFESRHGGALSPIVYRDLVIQTNHHLGESFIIALDAATGEPRWKVERQSQRACYGTPCIYEPVQGKPELIVITTKHGITSLDPATGKTLWEVAGVFDKRVVSSPIIASGLIVGTTGSGYGGNYLAAVRPGVTTDDASSAIAYKVTRSAPYVPTPVARGDLMFLWSGNGVVSCVRSKTGEELWRERVGGNYLASPVCVNGRLYGVSTDGDVVVLAASEKYELLARNALGEPSHATPAVAGGVMYVRTLSHLISIGGTK